VINTFQTKILIDKMNYEKSYSPLLIFLMFVNAHVLA
jgi:hypothetical protein